MSCELVEFDTTIMVGHSALLGMNGLRNLAIKLISDKAQNHLLPDPQLSLRADDLGRLFEKAANDL